jgi:hypothetical protein
VLALAVGDWVQSLHRLIRERQRVRWSLVALVAAIVVFLAILEEFFGLWRLAGVERFTYLDLLAFLPDDVPEGGLDLAEYYMENRRLLYLLLSLWVFGVFLRLTDLHEVVTGRPADIVHLASMFPWQTTPLLAVLALMSWSSSMRVQLAGVLIAFVLVNSAMIGRTIEVPAL